MAKINSKSFVIAQPVTLQSILNTKVKGFKRLDVKMADVRISESKKGKYRFAVLIERDRGSTLYNCYVAATIMLFRKYNIGTSPLVEGIQEPAEFKIKYTAVFNHIKEVFPSVILKNTEFIHTQAERLFEKYGNRGGYWNHYSMDETQPL